MQVAEMKNQQLQQGRQVLKKRPHEQSIQKSSGGDLAIPENNPYFQRKVSLQK